MKFLSSLIVLGVMIAASTSAMAEAQYRILTCGDVEIWSEYHATAACEKRNVGPLYGTKDWNLGRVYTVIRNSNTILSLPKTAEPDRSLLGRKKGFGFFENDYFILDLSNTADIEPQLNFHSQIHLWDKTYGGYIRCQVSDVMNLSCRD